MAVVDLDLKACSSRVLETKVLMRLMITGLLIDPCSYLIRLLKVPYLLDHIMSKVLWPLSRR